MQHERDPLGGSELFEHHEQCETDRFGQQRFVLWVDPVWMLSQLNDTEKALAASSQ